MFCYKCQKLALIHFYRFTWCQIIGNHDHRLGSQFSGTALSGQHGYHPVGNVLNICRTCLKIFIIHIRKHFSKMISGHGNCILCIYLL